MVPVSLAADSAGATTAGSAVAEVVSCGGPQRRADAPDACSPAQPMALLVVTGQGVHEVPTWVEAGVVGEVWVEEEGQQTADDTSPANTPWPKAW